MPDFGLIEFEDFTLTDDIYRQEKRRGGESSYQEYKPLRNKLAELCQAELTNKRHTSASQLCNKIANIIEAKYPELLVSFQRYQNSKKEGIDWRWPSFYNWCNQSYKKITAGGGDEKSD